MHNKIRIDQEKEMQRGKMVLWGGLRNSWEKEKSVKGKGEKEKYIHLNAVSKNSNEIRKPFSVINEKK